ncbi:hypothetical protein TSOC_010307 [Tetrabaena socialis]|uniref:Uncharacterized protein n=1 Tax=Tetrabaena socialis TaxID=47790 RepID=A0A2J7ZTQ8_9CHLO|nr:hypothetical protein TSOC_010307 [Tetrabaena socialis]|eukprot:PNH03620.1 hypothetical protein TSOC_010307 [Tetrabaena socialis]
MMLHAGGCPGALGTARSQRPPIPRILGARGASPRCTPRQERHAATSAVAGKDPVVFPSGPLPIPAGPVQHKDHAGPLVFVFRLSPFMPPLRDPAPPPDRSPPFRRFQAVSGPGWALWAERDYDVLDYIRVDVRLRSIQGCPAQRSAHMQRLVGQMRARAGTGGARGGEGRVRLGDEVSQTGPRRRASADAGTVAAPTNGPT